MSHRIAAHVHVWALQRVGALAERRAQGGQGTVEYVGVVVTMALLLGAVATASKGWGNDIGNALKEVLKDAVGLAAGRLGGGN